VVVDEAIITGSTLTIVTELLRSAGAKEIHLRIPSPIHKSSCDKGFLSPKKDLLFNKLIKNPSNTSNEQAEKAFKEYFKSDSISFLEKERFMTKKLEGFLCCKCLCEQS
jgi:amidophosphoribosyltransferase